MRIRSILLAAATAITTSLALDRLETVETCDADIFVFCGLYRSWFHTDFGVYEVDAHDGCRGTGVPGMTEFCVDWPRGRGHFKYSHQDFKRCFVRQSEEYFTDGICPNECWRKWWGEVPCSWREAGDDSDATVSVSELPGNVTEATASIPAAAATAKVK